MWHQISLAPQGCFSEESVIQSETDYTWDAWNEQLIVII